MNTHYDLISNLINETNKRAIGFESALRRLNTPNYTSDSKYPPFDLEKVSDTQYQITMALAGFKKEDLDITVENNILSITGKVIADAKDRYYIHNGIAKRDFVRNFILADHLNIVSAELSDGILVIDMVYELPEAMKPRKVEINTLSLGNTDNH